LGETGCCVKWFPMINQRKCRGYVNKMRKEKKMYLCRKLTAVRKNGNFEGYVW
jgi:hypothetical protein